MMFGGLMFSAQRLRAAALNGKPRIPASGPKSAWSAELDDAGGTVALLRFVFASWRE